jgi:hypothetical protein
MEGNSGRRLSAPRPRMCGVEPQRSVDCVSAVMHAVLHAQRLSGRLFDSNRARYVDALYVAAEHLARPGVVANLDQNADRMLHGLTDEPAWPTLRGRLLLLAAAGADPVSELLYATETRDLTSADDQAAVIDSRIHDMNQVAVGGPLPWLPGIPHRLAADPNWGPYLRARSQLVAELADQVRRTTAADHAPAWTGQRPAVPAELIADIQVWRAATQVDPGDLRPTGPAQFDRAGRSFQLQLDQRLAATDTRTGREWRPLVAAEVPSVMSDPFLPELTERLSDLTGQATTPPSFCGRRQLRDRCPTTIPRQPCGGASSTGYRKPNPQPRRLSQRPGARPRHRRARGGHRRSARAADPASASDAKRRPEVPQGRCPIRRPRRRNTRDQLDPAASPPHLGSRRVSGCPGWRQGSAGSKVFQLGDACGDDVWQRKRKLTANEPL